MSVIVDTNVLIAANGRDCLQANARCQFICIEQLEKIEQSGTLVIDDARHILNEYENKVSSDSQPGIGDAFLKWILQNQGTPESCQQVNITWLAEDEFEAFPADPALAKFDRSDRKFVAVALTHPDYPPILNAVDSDWQRFESALAKYAIRVRQLCPDCLKA